MQKTSYADLVVDQGWNKYRAEDHKTWSLLFNRQMEVIRPRACTEFLAAVDDLGFTADAIPRYEEINERLESRTGWQVVATDGLVKSKAFFDMLSDRKFPAGTFIRGRDQLDYLEEPDIFHDLFGHIPLLSNEAYADYMHEYGRAGAKALKFKATKNLARLNWWTIEFGLIKKGDKLKIYGAGLLSSYGEAQYCLDDPSAHHLEMDIDRCMRTKVYISDMQPCYFAIDSFESLFQQAKSTDFTPLYERIKGTDVTPKATEFLPFDVTENDNVLRRGTQDYIRPKLEELKAAISI